MARTYLTSPIYYVNGDPHIGHAHTTVTADALKRIALMRGMEVFMTTGTDEHGQKNQAAAEASGMPTHAYLDMASARFRALFDRLEVGYDLFVRTTQPSHMAAVTEVLRRLWEKELIVKKLYRGLYCVGCEQFKKPSDLDELGRCPDHLVVPVESEEVNYFLVLAPFQAWLVDHIRTHDDFIQPEFFRGEILAMLEEPLDDLSLSRPKSRVSLGVELPFDPDYVTYVWFDALINYVSSLGWPDDTARMGTWWPAVSHLMAKDIIKTHCIYWPIMLRAVGIDAPRHCLVHGYWVGEGGRKMSKSLGNAVDPVELLDLTGAAGLRFYLLKNMTSVDSTVSTRLVVETYNSDLANTVGNLYSRVLKFADGGRIPDPAALDPADTAVLEACVALAADAFARVEFETLSLLPKTILEIAARLNAHVAAVAPWKLAKEEGGGGDRLASVVYTMLEGLRVLAELAWPVMPGAAERALERLGRPPPFSGAEAHRFVAYALPRGGAIPAASDPLFPRVR